MARVREGGQGMCRRQQVGPECQGAAGTICGDVARCGPAGQEAGASPLLRVYGRSV